MSKEPKPSPNADEQLKTPQDGPIADTAPVPQESGVNEEHQDETKVSLEEALAIGFDKWLEARLANSVLSRNTEAWNLLRKEKATLIEFITKEVQ